ncbi:MAG: hypothetical protein WC343_05415 [Bacilli bacterium]|jgi:hypothetical protein
MTRGDISHGNVFANLHDVTLQRLDVYQNNNGHPVFYDSTHFAPTVEAWNAVPVIYVATEPGKPAQHPRAEDVASGTLPPQFRNVGTASGASLAGSGEPALRGAVSFTDPEIEALASAGKLSLSTGFSSLETPDPERPGATRIAGTVTPNHVLVFERGACPNCYPNDNGARFENLRPENDMSDEETKGLLKTIADALTRPGTQHNNLAEFENLKTELAAEKAKTAEFANLQQELATLKAAQETAKKDAAWSAMKVNLPAGWLGAKETETRKEYEADAGAFALKLIQFKSNLPGEKPAEGSGVGQGADGAESTEEQQFANMAAEFEKRLGIKVV